MSKDLIDIRQLSKEQISSFFQQNGLPKYRGSQIYEWIWRKGVTDFNMMTNLSIELRSLLINKFINPLPTIHRKVVRNYLKQLKLTLIK